MLGLVIVPATLFRLNTDSNFRLQCLTTSVRSPLLLLYYIKSLSISQSDDFSTNEF